MSQNVLADSFTMPSFRHIPEWISSWKDRKPKLVAEYVTYKPDVIGLQELDKCDELLESLNKALENIDEPYKTAKVEELLKEIQKNKTKSERDDKDKAQKN